MNRLDGKVALVSGAARGIGAATARLMVEAGARVVLGDVLDERGQATTAEIGEAAHYQRLDVTQEGDWQAAVAAAQDRFGRLDILVNNAGLFLGKDIEAANLADWHRLCAVNLTGVFLGTKLALPALREAARDSAHGSAIVNLASVAGLVGSQLDPLYSLTKGGVTLFTKSATLEFAHKAIASGSTRSIRGSSIRIWAGRCSTPAPRTPERTTSRRQSGNLPPLIRSVASERLTTSRRGIVFLASNDSAFTTGAGLVVDGGLTSQ